MSQRRKLDLTLKFKCQTRAELDSILQRDFQLLRQHGTITQSIDKTEIVRNNKLIMDYVHIIYDEYGIADPLKGLEAKPEDSGSSVYGSQSGNKKKSKLSLSKHITPSEPENKKGGLYYIGGRRSREVSSGMDSSRIKFTYETPKKGSQELQAGRTRFNSVQSKFEGDSSRLKQSFNQGTNIYNPFRSTIASESRTHQINPEENIQRSVTKPLNFQEEPKLISEIYRYCIGCDKALLDANIRHHQKEKIKHISDKVAKKTYELPDQSIREFKLYSSNAVVDSRENRSITQKFSQNYNRSMRIGKTFCQSLEEVNRLNWFMRMREHLRKALQTK